MNPKITTKNETGTEFTLEGVNVSFANAIRRTILSDIPTVVFKTSPYEENRSVFLTNTTLFNNEVLKQRLSSIPIHLKDITIPLENYLLEVDVKNTTDTIISVTTKDFKIKDKTTNTYLTTDNVKEIFPPFIPNMKDTEYYIEFLTLRPRISEDIEGEHISLTCEFSIGTSKEDGVFNVVGACSYGNTVDETKKKTELGVQQQKWKDSGMSVEDIKLEEKNWSLLDGKRCYKSDSFDFIIETIGVFENEEILQKSCDIILEKLGVFDKNLDDDSVSIVPSKNTMENSYDITLDNEDYTIGNCIQYVLYTRFFEGKGGEKVLNYCGFKKLHPHDSFSIFRLAFIDAKEKSDIKILFKMAIADCITVFRKLKEMF